MGVPGILDTGPQGSLGLTEATVCPYAPEVRGTAYQGQGMGWQGGLLHTVPLSCPAPRVECKHPAGVEG